MSTSFGEVLAATGLLAGVSPANLEESHPTGLPVQRWNALSKRHAALLPNLCAFGVSFDIGRNRTGIFRRSRSTIDEGGTRCPQRVGKIGPARQLTSTAEGAESDAVAASGEASALVWE